MGDYFVLSMPHILCSCLSLALKVSGSLNQQLQDSYFSTIIDLRDLSKLFQARAISRLVGSLNQFIKAQKFVIHQYEMVRTSPTGFDKDVSNLF